MSRQFWLILALGLFLGAGFQALHAADTKTSGKVFEIRTYHTFPGKLDALNTRFREHTMKIFESHGMHSVGYWMPREGDAAGKTLIYIIWHANREAAKANWEAFNADPEWQKVKAASEADGKLVEKVDSVFTDATDYSPIQ